MSDTNHLAGEFSVLESEPKPQRIQHTPDGRLMVHAHAKLNLGLRIHPVRPDGFHDLESWMVPISWHDTLFVTGEGERLELHVTGRAQGIPVELEKNLVGRAALALAAAAGIEPRGRIELHKVLPPGGGLGGGSSDAANALVALNEAWGLRWPEAKLLEIAASLGSDVPFFVREGGQPSLCTGRGEIMKPLRPAHPLFAVLIISEAGCPTKQVYAAFDAGHQRAGQGEAWARLNAREAGAGRCDAGAGGSGGAGGVWCRYAGASADELNSMLLNDLEAPAFAVAPWLAELRGRASHIAQRPVHMTGSGATLFSLCATGAQAGELQTLWARELLVGKAEDAGGLGAAEGGGGSAGGGGGGGAGGGVAGVVAVKILRPR